MGELDLVWVKKVQVIFQYNINGVNTLYIYIYICFDLVR